MNDESVGIAEKIAMFDCYVWPMCCCLHNDAYALKKRLIGNEHFRSQDFETAVEAYNACIFCSTTIVNRGIAYANRAAAYLKLHSYQDCLDSIHLAKGCSLPPDTMIKVLAREKVAIEGLELENVASGAKISDLPIQLSYRSNKRMSSFVFCLMLKEAGNPYGGIITTKDLLPGDVLVIEPPIMTYAGIPNMCNNCLRSCGGLQPCKCGTMFCSPSCQKEAFDTYHNFECPLAEHLYSYSFEDRLALRVFFKLIQRFEDFASLREYLEKIKSPNPFEGDDFEAWPDAGSFESQFRLYWATERPSMNNCIVRKQNLYRSDEKYNNFHTSMVKAAYIIDMLKLSKEIPSLANGSDDWAFLSEQLFRLFFYKTFTSKAVAISDKIEFQTANDDVWMSDKTYVRPGCLALYGSASLFRTSCRANVDMDYKKNMLIVRASECIPRGTELLALTK